MSRKLSIACSLTFVCRRVGADSRFALVALAAFLGFATAAVGQSPEPHDFANHVLPILRANCLACHNTQKAEGGLNLETHELLLRGGDSGPSLVVGKGVESELVRRVVATDDSVMPPEKNAVGAKHLTPDEIARIQAWIDAGAIPGTARSNASMPWRQIPESVRPMYAIDATHDGQFVAVGRGNQATVYRWPAIDAATDTASLIDPVVQSQLQTAAPVAHLDLIQSVAISPDGIRIATGGFRDIKLWRRNLGPTQDGLAALLRGSHIACVSPDGTRVAKGTKTGSLEILRVDRTELPLHLECPSPASSASWSVDSTSLWVLCEDTSVHQFVIAATEGTASTSSKPSFSQKLEQALRSLTWIAPDTLVSITEDRKLQWWSLSVISPEPQAKLSKIDRNADISDVISMARFQEAGAARLAVASADGSIRVISGVDGSPLRTIAHGAPVVEILASGDHTKLASLGVDGIVKAWNPIDGSLLWEQKGDHDSQHRLDQAETRSARQKSKVERAVARLPELEKAKQAEMDALGKLQTSRNPIQEELTKKQTELEANEKMVAEGEAALLAAKQAIDEAMKKAEQTQKDLDARKQQQMAAQKAKADVETKLATLDKTIAGAEQAIERAAATLSQFQATIEAEKQRQTELEQRLVQTQSSLQASPALRGTFSADHRTLITLHLDGSVRLVRSDKGTTQSVLAGGILNPSTLLATSTGWILCTAEDGRAVGWDWSHAWTLERTIGTATDSPFSDRITALDWSDDSQMLVVGSGAPSRFGELKMLRVSDGVVIKDWGQVHSDSILVAKISPDGTTVATGAADKLVRLHRTDNDAPTRTFEGHTHHVLGVAWHDDGHWLASSSADNTIKVWDVESGTSIRTIPGFGKEVTALAFVGRTNQLLSTSADRQTRLHDASNGGLIRAMGGPNDAVYCAVVAGKTPVALAGGQDGVLWIWQLDNGQTLHQIK